jgi:PAS domain S-box-containing protein
MTSNWNIDDLLSVVKLSRKELFDAIPGYALVVDKNYRILRTNRGFVRDFGKALGMHCYQALRKRSKPCAECLVKRTVEEKRQIEGEATLIGAKGETIYGVVQTVPLLSESGEVIAVLEMITDVTPIVSLKNDLAESEKQYRQLFDIVPCYISVQDRNLRIVSANRRFREDFGDQLGGFCFETYKHRDEPCLICPVMATFQDGLYHTREEVVTNLRGELRNVLVQSAPIRDEEGEVEYVMEMSSDISEVRSLQNQLQSLGLLVGQISHGIKGVLMGLDGGMYLLDTGLEKENIDRTRKGWEMVERNVSHVRSMVHNLLYYAKDREPDWEPVDMARLAHEVCALLEAKASRLQVRIIQEISAQCCEIRGDAKALHSMLVNLLENALDACRTDHRKSEHWIKIVLGCAPRGLSIEIADNGIGMDRETREQVFSLFFSSKGSDGTGLGLFIADKIARKHGGTISVESKPGVGTRFLIRLPRGVPAI